MSVSVSVFVSVSVVWPKLEFVSFSVFGEFVARCFHGAEGLLGSLGGQ